jgi:hypothetical protein
MIEAGSTLGAFFVSVACSFGFCFWIFAFFSYESLFRYVARFSFLYFRPSSSLICSEPSVVLGVKAFLTEVSTKMAVIVLFSFTFLRFLCTIYEGFELSLE